ncbi:hypothetical protein Tco_0610648 [Tanacetum coccineum]
MPFSKRQGNDAVCYTKPLDSLKSWNDHLFWVDAFACPASFSWNTSKSVSKDPFPKSSEFNAEHYATIVAYPTPFHKYPEPFLCLVGISHNYTLDKDTYPQFLRESGEEIDLLSFTQTADPTKVRVSERQRTEDEPRLLDTTVGCVVPLLPIAPAHAESELDASVDKLFDEGGSGNQAEQGDSVSGADAVGIQLVNVAAETIDEDVGPVQPRCQRKRKTVAVDAGEPSHPAKKLRDDHRTLGGSTVGGKSWSAFQCLLVGAVQNAEVRGEAIPTLPFMTSSVSATPERRDGDHTKSLAGTNLHTIGAPQRFIFSLDSSHHSGANIAEAEVDSFVRPSVPLMTVATTVTADHTASGFSDLIGSDFIVGDDDRTCREIMDEFAPPKFFVSIRVKEAEVAEAVRPCVEASKSEVVEESLRDEVKVLKEQNASLEQEKIDLSVKVADIAASVKVKEQEVADLDAQVHELEASFAGLQEKVTTYEGFINQLEKFQDEKMKEVNEKFDKLCANFVEMTLHLEEKFYPHLLTNISGRRWLLTHVMKLAIAKCLNSTEYLSTLGAAIGKAVEKGTQEGLSAGITHGAKGRKLTDVAVYNPCAEADYLSALQRLQSVNFSLIAELRANKDASIDTIINLLRLEDTLAERLDVSSSRVWKIKENIANHVSALRDVFVPLFEPLSAVALEGTEGTSSAAPGTADTTVALSIVVASISTVRPISIDDYEVTSADDQATTDGNVADKDANPFPNVDDVELNVSE